MKTVGRWAGIFVLLMVCARVAAAGNTQREAPGEALWIDEGKIEYHLLPQGQLRFSVVNPTNKTVTGSFAFELLDEKDAVAASLTGKFSEKPGETAEELDWPASKLPSNMTNELGWYRLLYVFFPSEDSGLRVTGGIVQFGTTFRDGFQLQMAAAGKVEPGTRYPVGLRALSYPEGRPLARQQIQLTMEIGDNDEKPMNRRVTTDGNGNATVTLEMPRKPKDEKGTVWATATRGGFEEIATVDFEFPKEPQARVTVSTDKPLYQPGQTVHMRMMAFGADKKVLQGRKIEVSIENEENEEEFRQTVTTSRFGIASLDWVIPNLLRLGGQTVKARLMEEGKEDEEVLGGAWIRVSRYELPTYTVQAEPDRTYYLPGQDAVVDVHAEYLFGQPVKNGKVKLVKQQERRWNYKAQKWDVEESVAVTGELGSDGHCKAKINLAEELKDLSDGSYARFRDISLAAYVTDGSTGRTEQGRFNVRVTKEPIHLYVLEPNFEQNLEGRLFYVTSSYADGTPVSVEGEISAAAPKDEDENGNRFDETKKTIVAHFHTNKYGIGRAELGRLPDALIRVTRGPRWRYGELYDPEQAFDEREALLELEARDAEGREGTTSESINFDAGQQIFRVRTNHALYHPGETIEAEIQTNVKAEEAIVNVWSGEGLLRSQAVQLKEGRGKASIPFERRFHGKIYVSAYVMVERKSELGAVTARWPVLFPAKEELEVKVGMRKTVYRPGETVSSEFDVTTPDGKTTESALGVLVYDKAVAERVRTDEEFGRYGFNLSDYGWCCEWESIGGIRFRDLMNLDANKPFPEELDLVTEGLLHARYGEWWGASNDFDESGWIRAGAKDKFKNALDKELEGAKKALTIWVTARGEYPQDEGEVREALKAIGLDFDSVRDPWGMPFRTKLRFWGRKEILGLVSNGIDKKPGTDDDFTAAEETWSYFEKTGKVIRDAAREYATSTGKFIREYPTLKEEMKKRGVDLDTMRDPWGKVYRYDFDVERNQYRIVVNSSGPDGIFNSKTRRSWDDVQEYIARVTYFVKEGEALSKALAEEYVLTSKFPTNEEELKPVLARSKLTKEQLTDPWGHPYYFTFEKKSRYSDRVDVRTYSDSSGTERQRTKVTPVTQEVEYVDVMSHGEASEADNRIPFSVAEFNRVIAERSSRDIRAMETKERKPLPAGVGTITGVVTDGSGAAVPNATVTAVSENETEYKEKSAAAGDYRFANLPAGIYEVRCWASGFRTSTVLQVPVQAGNETKVDFTLQVGVSTTTVEVDATVDRLRTETAVANLPVNGRDAMDFSLISAHVETQAVGTTTEVQKPLFTPKLRKYFPETLVWRPEVITDATGHARIHFPMGDNITAWKMSVMASTVEGQVGVAEKELRSFQPFFVESDPPKVLTEGDEISQPVVLRNYLEKAQTIVADLHPDPWFAILSKPEEKVTVEAGGDARAVFTYKTIQSAKAAKQRVTARNPATGDAIERKLMVHPNGQEITFRTSQVLRGTQNAMMVRLPEAAIEGSVDAELRIYPNLLAHVLDAMDGIGRRPTGCGEQITSTAYVSLLALEVLKKMGLETPGKGNPRSAIAAKARAAVQEGYERLIALQSEDGSIGYWNRLRGDGPLTAYVLRFLNEAKAFIPADESVVRRMRKYLLGHQIRPGRWGMYRWDLKKEVEDANTTAYVARALAGDWSGTNDSASKEERGKEQAAVRMAVDEALRGLEKDIDAWSDAYVAGNYALAAVASKRVEHIANARAVLKRLMHSEGDASYWSPEANTTPFYGWGRTGRLETTALAVEALENMDPSHADRETQEMVQRGLQYLLSRKDRYAVWYSTQATQNALEAMVAAIPAGGDAEKAMTTTLKVNGKEVRTLALPPANEASGPITVKIAGGLNKGENTIEVTGAGKTRAMNATAFTSYYLPWGDSTATAEENTASGESRALQLRVKYDKQEAKEGETVRCKVGAERIGFKGYGMMLAEVGLPPGAEVDRASLEDVKASDAGVYSYEVLPDRVVFYVWPTAGGSSFEFGFFMRYGMKAWSEASSLYDYYNPEAAATVAPVKFVVQ